MKWLMLANGARQSAKLLLPALIALSALLVADRLDPENQNKWCALFWNSLMAQHEPALQTNSNPGFLSLLLPEKPASDY